MSFSRFQNSSRLRIVQLSAIKYGLDYYELPSCSLCKLLNGNPKLVICVPVTSSSVTNDISRSERDYSTEAELLNDPGEKLIDSQHANYMIGGSMRLSSPLFRKSV